MSRRPVIAVAGTGNQTEPAVSSARELGRLIAEHSWVLITGGRNAGVMRAANEGAKAVSNGLTIGILPDSKTEVSPAVDVAIVTDTGEARNNVIVLSADVVIACGVEDPGTASEVSFALKAGRFVIVIAASQAARDFFTEIAGQNINFVDRPEDAIELAKSFTEEPTS
jgi:uncharacterized protein (TIGR00725 family)